MSSTIYFLKRNLTSTEITTATLRLELDTAYDLLGHCKGRDTQEAIKD